MHRIEKLVKEMQPLLSNIPLQDFPLMKGELLEIMLSKQKLCPTIDITFWTKGPLLQHISSECLYRILAENPAPVKLGKLWEQVGWQVADDFTDEMEAAWSRINHNDFYLMQPDTLKVITLVPKVCSALGVSFWTRETIKDISGRCLHILLTSNEEPVKLGNLWSSIERLSFYHLLRFTRSSLNLIHPDDRVLARDRIVELIKDCYGLCSVLESSFWTRETIRYMSLKCLEAIIENSAKSVRLGELWGHIPRQTITGLEDSMFKYFKNIAGSDFQYMPSPLLNRLFSFDWLKDYDSPLVLPSQVVLSSKAEGVRMSPMRFAKFVKSAPSVAGQILWYSKGITKDVLSHCDGNGIRSLSLDVPGEKELDWKGLFARLEHKYSLEGRKEFFDQMIKLVSDNASPHFCATLLDLDEYWSLT